MMTWIFGGNGEKASPPYVITKASRVKIANLKKEGKIPSDLNIYHSDSAWTNESHGLRYSMKILSDKKAGFSRVFMDSHTSSICDSQMKYYKNKEIQVRKVLTGETCPTQCQVSQKYFFHYTFLIGHVFVQFVFFFLGSNPRSNSNMEEPPQWCFCSNSKVLLSCTRFSLRTIS